MYLYTTTLFRTTDDVIGLPASNDVDVADFEDNHQADCLAVTGVTVAETTFVIEKTYSDFAYLVETNTVWSSVKCVTTDRKYQLYLLSTNPL